MARSMPEKREPIVLSLEVAPLTSGQVLKTFRRDLTIEGFWVRFYEGQQRNLHVVPWIETAQGVWERLFVIDDDGLADDFLAGNDDVIDRKMSRAVEAHSRLLVEYENIHATEAYTLHIILDTDYRGGVNSVA